jgi:protein-S-isoprenylcysteine O-methyltransferase Ste14
MFVAFRTLTYATLFVGFLLVYLPSRVLLWSGIVRPAAMQAPQIAGIVIATIGAGIAAWCIVTFVHIGKGTPAPFDPPRRLVVQGPYCFVRNPMYIGGALTLLGAALFYRSLFLLGYGCIFLLVACLFVLFYEEPTLRRTFGPDYDAYCHRVSRWLPRAPSS